MYGVKSSIHFTYTFSFWIRKWWPQSYIFIDLHRLKKEIVLQNFKSIRTLSIDLKTAICKQFSIKCNYCSQTRMLVRLLFLGKIVIRPQIVELYSSGWPPMSLSFQTSVPRDLRIFTHSFIHPRVLRPGSTTSLYYKGVFSKLYSLKMGSLKCFVITHAPL